jgi:hypothetical protein
MPTKTSAKTPSRPRRSAPTTSAGGRFGRPATSTSKLSTRPKAGKPKGKSGVKGRLSGLLSSLPVAGLGKKAASKSSSSSRAKATAKPAVAVVAAAAGAVFGRKQLQKRKADEPMPATPVPTTPGAVNETTARTEAPRAVRQRDTRDDRVGPGSARSPNLTAQRA